MSRALVIRPKAEAQAAAARDWYDDQFPGLGDDFLERLDEAVLKAQRDPLHYQKVLHEIRRVLLRRFPFAVFRYLSIRHRGWYPLVHIGTPETRW